MKYAMKKEGNPVKAYCLGEGTTVEKQMVEEGKIRLLSDGQYELFSQEAVNGEGQRAEAGDFFKIDNAGYPYPNKREWFFENHTHVKEHDYIQKPKKLAVWEMGDENCEEMEFLLESGILHIDETNEKKYYSAYTDGAPLSAPKDAVIVFRYADRDENGSIKEIFFSFVVKSEFEQTYDYVE